MNEGGVAGDFRATVVAASRSISRHLGLNTHVVIAGYDEWLARHCIRGVSPTWKARSVLNVSHTACLSCPPKIRSSISSLQSRNIASHQPLFPFGPEAISATFMEMCGDHTSSISMSSTFSSTISPSLIPSNCSSSPVSGNLFPSTVSTLTGSKVLSSSS